MCTRRSWVTPETLTRPDHFYGCDKGRPGGGGALEVRFAHPVRLSPDTHSQGHGRPCLHDPAAARACLAEGIPENGVSVKMSWLALPDVHTKTFSAHVVFIFQLVVSGKRFSMHEKTENVTAETLTTPLLDFHKGRNSPIRVFRNVGCTPGSAVAKTSRHASHEE